MKKENIIPRVQKTAIPQAKRALPLENMEYVRISPIPEQLKEGVAVQPFNLNGIAHSSSFINSFRYHQTRADRLADKRRRRGKARGYEIIIRVTDMAIPNASFPVVERGYSDQSRVTIGLWVTYGVVA